MRDCYVWQKVRNGQGWPVSHCVVTRASRQGNNEPESFERIRMKFRDHRDIRSEPCYSDTHHVTHCPEERNAE